METEISIPLALHTEFISGQQLTCKNDCRKNYIKDRLTSRAASKYADDNNPRVAAAANDIFPVDIYIPRERVKIASADPTCARARARVCNTRAYIRTHTNARRVHTHTGRGGCARAQVAQSRFRTGGKAEVGSPLAGSQVHARSRYTRTRLASAGVPGGARRQPRTNVDTKPRPELLRTTVQRACVPRPDHGGPS